MIKNLQEKVASLKEEHEEDSDLLDTLLECIIKTIIKQELLEEENDK